YSGRPGHGYPWPFFGAPFLAGAEIAHTRLTEAERARLARPLAAFLRALHRAEVPGADALPVDLMGRTDMAKVVPVTTARLAEAAELAPGHAPPGSAAGLEAALGLPPPSGRAVAHGDLHLRHLLVGDDGVLTGVIDWDDVCRADPSIDLPLVWSFLPPEGRRDFLAAYGDVSEEQLLRARVLALFLCAALATYAHHEGLAGLEGEATAGLARAASDGGTILSAS